MSEEVGSSFMCLGAVEGKSEYGLHIQENEIKATLVLAALRVYAHFKKPLNWTETPQCPLLVSRGTVEL